MSLERLALSWRRRWWLGAGLSALATGILLAVAVRSVLAGALAAAAALAACWFRRPRMDARTVARHFNRALPSLHESAELLLVDPAALSPIEILQRERTRRAYEQVGDHSLPHRPWRWALAYTAGAGALAVILLVSSGGGAIGARSPTKGPRETRTVSLGDVVVRIDPPAYTARRTRRTTRWDFDAEAGSDVRWTIEGRGPVAAAALVLSNGDTVPLTRGPDGFSAARQVERSALYFVTLADSAGVTLTSDFHQLTVIPDAAPTITVLAPESRTLIHPGSPSAVPLRVLVGDDYGVAETRLVATLTTGQGEGVKFREQELPFERTAPRPDRRPGAVLERTIDARALGLGPGDELYFHITARDVKQPLANETRSETFFITLVDTAKALLADFSGLAIDLTPEYFRSQRQIIIDTEKLLAERSRIPAAEFRSRSENIGLDQHLLRLRYGEIVGDEVVEGETDPQATHQHDIEENATRLAPQVKAALTAALAQMWDAELRLRTSDPQAALPFEYRALELLKEVQQSARVYVRRVGFEPPPLEPDRKRLTGDLSKIGPPTLAHDVAGRDSLAGIRAAVTLLQARAPTGPDVVTLERAGQELAAIAVQQPGRHLETLRRLRELIRSLGAAPTCDACIAPVVSGLLRALPVPLPAASGAARSDGVARRYFELLQGTAP